LFFTKLADRSTGRGNTEGVSLEIDRGFEDLRPFDTGLVLPPTGRMSSALGLKLLLEVKSGRITADRAIEDFSDEYNSGTDSPQQKQTNGSPRLRTGKISFRRKCIEKLKRASSTSRGTDQDYSLDYNISSSFMSEEESTSQDEKECDIRREGS
jgi:hypothetical protein